MFLDLSFFDFENENGKYSPVSALSLTINFKKEEYEVLIPNNPEFEQDIVHILNIVRV